ncbi:MULTISPECIES: THC0290_0291 family protein [Flavobacterium]|uniref:THC0290_0291 family protein n=1 Tax=Flavobacterium TaxID=237 RepID=UPI001FCC3A8D|nr:MULTISPECIES: glutamate dehydrogenase [Flavobacterium]UOK43045.1 glutamate dehydrogenase [Flavobacterium enshiense]
MPRKILFTLLMAFGINSAVRAQFGFSHEIGAIAGPVMFMSDFGERYDWKTNASNTGIGIGIIHYLNFSYSAECNCYKPETYFNDHFKLRTELSYNRTNLEHYGEWVAPEKTSVYADQLRAMKGTASNTDIGMQLEYFPLSIRDFTATIGSLGPFASLGAHYTFYSPEVTSTRGRLNQPGVLYPKYVGATSNDGGSTWSVVASVGTRYKLTELSDLMLDLRWQYYFSNWVDGVNPDPNLYPENKANEWLVWLNFGYIYYLE